MVFLFCNNADAQFAGGDGSEDNPYQVTTLEQLQLIADSLYLDKHFIQIANIDASETVDWNDGKGFEPIGRWDASVRTPFTGTYDGNGYVIQYLTINRSEESRIGLFGSVAEAIIRNVTLVNVDIIGLESIGGLIGLAFAEWVKKPEPEYLLVEIHNSSVSGSVSGVSFVGGLVGFNSGEVYYSSASAEVSVEGIYVGGDFLGGTRAGGLIGTNGGTIEGSYATGNVSGSGIGGLVGYNDGFGRTPPGDGIVRNSYATGNVSGRGAVGGLIGRNYSGKVQNTHATGNASGEFHVGGLIGFNEGVRSDNAVRDSHAAGDVSGTHYVGGLIGRFSGQLYASFATGSVTGQSWVGGLIGGGGGSLHDTYAKGPVTGDSLVGGLIGYNTGEIHTSYASGSVSGSYRTGGLVGEMNHDRGATLHQSYWDTLATGQFEGIGAGEPDGATGLTTEQMTGQNAWIHMHEFDFEQVWQLTEGYPALYWEEPDSVLVTPQAAFLQVRPREDLGYDFGEVGISEADTATIILFNTGNQEMHGELNISGPDAAHFELGPDVNPEFTFAPGDSLLAEVIFVPQVADTLQAALQISHNAPNKTQPLTLELSGKGKQTTSADDGEEQPQAFDLHQNHPNPFNPVTTITYDLPEQADVRLEIVDLLGRRVATLVSETQNPGTYQVSWDASDAASGSYIYRLRAGEFVQTRTMMLIK